MNDDGDGGGGGGAIRSLDNISFPKFCVYLCGRAMCLRVYK